MIDKVNDEFIVDCTNNSKEEVQQVYKFLVDNRNYSKIYLDNNAPIIVCNRKPGDSNWNSRQHYYSWFNSKKDLPIYTFEQFKEMYLEEEFVLPEKWCIKLKDNYDIINKWGKDYWENITSWGSLNASSEYMICSFKDKICTSANSTNGYIEITFEQFKKSILKQETMEKEIIGYKLVKPEYKGAYEKITNTANLDRIEDSLGKLNWVDKAIKDLKEAGVLELWFKPNYKEEKTIVKMYSSNKGEFEIEVVGKKAYYRPENKELTKEFIEEILDWFDDSSNHAYANRAKLLYSLKVDSLRVGCMEGTRQADWLKVYDLIK